METFIQANANPLSGDSDFATNFLSTQYTDAVGTTPVLTVTTGTPTLSTVMSTTNYAANKDKWTCKRNYLKGFGMAARNANNLSAATSAKTLYEGTCTTATSTPDAFARACDSDAKYTLYKAARRKFAVSKR